MFKLDHMKAAVFAALGAKLQRIAPPAVMPPAQWLGQHTNPRRNEERAALKLVGARQYKKHAKAARRVSRELATQTAV